MAHIDFSCKHDILIRNPDGSLQPMDEPYFEPKQIAPGTWSVLSDGDLSYLVEGENEAIVIDSGYGSGNIREFCQTLTDKPIYNIANTHDHFDHTANNSYFDNAFMSAKTAELATIPFPSFDGIEFPRDYKKTIIEEGYVIDLGGRTLEAFYIPDHGDGSLAFLDRKERILFSGDEIMPKFKLIKGYVEDVEAQFTRLAAHRHEYDWLCAGPAAMNNAAAVDNTLAAVRQIMAGDEGEPFHGMKFPKKPEQPVPPEYAGRKIYDRHGARPEDRKVDKDAAQDAQYKRCLVYNGLQVVFDSRRVRREK